MGVRSVFQEFESSLRKVQIGLDMTEDVVVEGWYFFYLICRVFYLYDKTSTLSTIGLLKFPEKYARAHSHFFNLLFEFWGVYQARCV